MPNTQNFNSLLRYIKRKLGVPVNLLEFTDDDIYDIIMEDVLPHMSQYIGAPSWIRMGSMNLLPNDGQKNEYSYLIPIPDDIILIDVQYAYISRESAGTLGMMSGALNFYDPRDTVIMNSFIDMLRSLDVVQTFQFIPPKEIQFDLPLQGDVILECKTEHSDLSTVPSDIYRDFIKPWSLAEVMENLAANRSKFETVSSSFGPIQLNWQKLETDARAIKDKIQQLLEALPPDHLISFID